MHPKQQQSAQKYKYPKWWVQSLLGGIPRIVVGYWTDSGMLQELRTFQTHQLPDLALDNTRGYHRAQVRFDRLE